MKTKVVLPTAEHRAFRDDAIALLRKHAGHLDSSVMLALSAHMVGQIVAMQDQRTVTREAALQIIMDNIEQGNREIMDNLKASMGKA